MHLAPVERNIVYHMKVIYDFGMNNGDNIEYYLMKGLPVVAVEANKALCAKAETRFLDAISRGQLTILNVALR